jgi:hypothetical protein
MVGVKPTEYIMGNVMGTGIGEGVPVVKNEIISFFINAFLSL